MGGTILQDWGSPWASASPKLSILAFGAGVESTSAGDDAGDWLDEKAGFGIFVFCKFWTGANAGC